MKLLLTFISCLFFVGMTAQDPDTQFELANEAYSSGKAEMAIQAYEALIAKNYRSEALYFNLANACLDQNKLGKAILYYEKALLIDPDDQDVLHNLQIARNRKVDDIQPLPPFFLLQWWQSLRDLCSATVWSVLFIGSLFLLLAAFAGWLLGPERTFRKGAFLAGAMVAMLSFILFMLALNRYQAQQRSGYAIITAGEADLHISYSSASKVLLNLHEGTKVEVLDKVGTSCREESADCWFKVGLANGEVGWLTFESLEEI